MDNPLVAAALDFCEAWARTKPWESLTLTCNEHDALEDLLRAAALDDAADAALLKHQADDDDPEDRHYQWS